MTSERLVLPRIATPIEPRAEVRARARGRAKFMSALIGLALAAIASRGVTLCLYPTDRVIAAGESQRYDQVVMRARRGEILDRDGRRLATSVDTPSVAVDPALVTPERRHELAVELAGILSLGVDDVEEKLGRHSRYVKLAGLVHPAVAARIEALHDPAIWTHRDPHRYYPEETLAAQLVGFVDASGVGHGGLEEALDARLRGGAVVVQRRRDRRGLDVDRPAGVDAGVNVGMDVHTTIDRRVQDIAEQALAVVVDESAPISASAIVVDVKTGDILALANYPTYNPNDIPNDPTPQKNHIVSDAIEPGSVFKPFTIAAAVDQGLVTSESTIDCERGSWAIGRARIHDDHPHGVVTIGEVMKYSSNIGTAKLALRMGADTVLPYLAAFGFGVPTGVQLPGERRGKIRDAATIKPIELATTAFGQGATATPIQLVMGIAAIANDGLRMKPRLVESIVDAQGVPAWAQRPTEVVQAVKPETAREVQAMMSLVTEEGGTGTRARVKGYKVAGKTGTAQKVKDGHYSDARISSFVGFVPADDPVIAIAVIVDEVTKGSKYGGIAAAPAFATIAGETLRHLGVPPDPALLDDAPAEDAAVAEVGPSEPIRLDWSGNAWTVPDLQGRSMRDVLVAMQDTGFDVEISGSGSAVSQQPPPGTRLAPGGRVSVAFE
jgi:cell division protein FtsI (penicillin-binding protein 3)